MTLVLYIPYKDGSLLISDRLNSLYDGSKEPVDKIIKLREDLVIGFSGQTEICQNILEVIKSKVYTLSDFEINETIRDRYHQIRLETTTMEIKSVEFLLVKRSDSSIRVWHNVDGFAHEEESDRIHAVGMYSTILPQIEEQELFKSKEEANEFGISLIGYVNRYQSGVGSPEIFGCNLAFINQTGIEISKIVKKPDLTPFIYQSQEKVRSVSDLEKEKLLLTEEDQIIRPKIEILPKKVANNIINIGYISTTTTGLETSIPLITEIIQTDINEYTSKLAYKVQFEFLIEDAKGQAAVHLEKIQTLNALGVKFILGGGWSSQAQASLSYCNDNNILLMSSSSTSPLLAISNDNFYRTCPTDLVQAPAVSRMIESYGKKALIVLQRGDAWADGIYNYFEPVFTSAGGIILERIRYSGEATEFTPYLEKAEKTAEIAVNEFGIDNVGILVISFSEIVVMANQAIDYSTIYNLTWFGTDGTALVQQLCDDTPEQANHLKIYSTLAAPTESSKYTELNDRYFALTNQPLGYYSACLYDGAWIIASAILHAQCYNPLDVIPLIHDVANNTFGASGWCKLNEEGDRAICDYQIWGYEKGTDGIVRPKVYGHYNGTNHNVTWYKKQ